MGKKSKKNKDKKKKILEDQKAQSTKESKKEESHAKPSVLAKLKVKPKAIFASLFIIIMLSILVAVGYLIFSKALSPRQIAKILPANNTVFTLEINMNQEHLQYKKASSLLEKYPQYSYEGVKKFVEETLGVNYENEFLPWFGRSAGIAFINSQQADGKIYKIYFAEVKDEAIARAAFEDNIEGVFGVSPEVNIVFIDDYVFAAKEKEALNILLATQKEEKLYNSVDYRRVDDNIPLFKTAFAYINFDKITNTFLKEIPMLSEKGISTELISPFLGIFKAEGFALIALDDKFVIQSFLSLNAKNYDKNQYITFEEKYSANLLEYVDSSVLSLWGGYNLENQIKRMIDILSDGNPNAVFVFDSILNNYIKKYFGPDVDYKRDLLPLFKNEYAFAIENVGGKNNYKLLLELKNPKEDMASLEKIFNNFSQIGAIFDSKVVETKLQDGTTSREIVAVPEEINRTKSEYEKIQINEMKIGSRPWGIFYASIDNVGVIATTLDGVKNTIDIMRSKRMSLKSSAIYDSHIKPLLSHADEISYFSIKSLLDVFNKGDYPRFFGIIKSLSSSKNYFQDGISTINYLNVE